MVTTHQQWHPRREPRPQRRENGSLGLKAAPIQIAELTAFLISRNKEKFIK
jgi:hypothetical protein